MAYKDIEQMRLRDPKMYEILRKSGQLDDLLQEPAEPPSARKPTTVKPKPTVRPATITKKPTPPPGLRYEYQENPNTARKVLSWLRTAIVLTTIGWFILPITFTLDYLSIAWAVAGFAWALGYIFAVLFTLPLIPLLERSFSNGGGRWVAKQKN